MAADTYRQTSYTLLSRALDAGDEAAWEQLVAHYRRFICYVLNGLGVGASDVDDLCQQVLVRLTRDLASFDRERARFRTWLSTLVRNAAFDYFRKLDSQQRRLAGFKVELECGAGTRPTETDAYIEKEWATYIAGQAMLRVRSQFQGQAIKVFELGLDGLTSAEIAEQTGLALSSVYTLRKRVKKRLYLELLELTEDLEP